MPSLLAPPSNISLRLSNQLNVGSSQTVWDFPVMVMTPSLFVPGGAQILLKFLLTICSLMIMGTNTHLGILLIRVRQCVMMEYSAMGTLGCILQSCPETSATSDLGYNGRLSAWNYVEPGLL